MKAEEHIDFFPFKMSLDQTHTKHFMNKKRGSLAKEGEINIYSVRFSLVSLFNGISTSVGNLMPKPFS